MTEYLSNYLLAVKKEAMLEGNQDKVEEYVVL